LTTQDLTNFVSDVHAQVRERLATEPDMLARDAFVSLVGEYLVDDGTLDDLETCYLRAPWQRRFVEVSGYDISDDGTVLHLVTTEFGAEGASVRRDRLEQLLRRAAAFAEFCQSGQHVLLEPSSPPFDMVERIASTWSTLEAVRVLVVTDGVVGTYRPADTVVAGLPASAQIWDATRLHRLVSSGRQQEEIRIDLEARGYRIDCLVSQDQADGYRCLLAILPGRLLAELYDEYHSRLLQRNVRAFLQARGKVNKGIAETIKDQPGRFLAYNNGVSATAREAWVDTEVAGAPVLRSLVDLQIVNGGQTTASLHQAVRKGADLNSVHVPAKITIIPDDRLESMAPEISRYANSQNAVTAADFEGNSRFHVGLERHSRSIWTPLTDAAARQTHWYYERVRGQYDVDRNRHPSRPRQREFEQDNPRRQRFGKTDAAKYELTYALQPHVVCLGGEKCFRGWTVSSGLGEREAPSADYFRHLVAKGILFSETRFLIQREDLGGYLGQITAHALALIVDRLHGVNLELVWRQQHLPTPLAESVSMVAQIVRKVLVDPDRTANVTEWCKKEECWKAVRAVDWEPSRELVQIGGWTTEVGR
jgi:hypothetical protein